jgi:2-polyprenyl-6-methoxyphenol hydroxylase-like FAD-dependent oxidoreductase
LKKNETIENKHYWSINRKSTNPTNHIFSNLMLDFVIIGGGIAGLACSIALEKNFKIRLFEKNSKDFMVGNGAGISIVNKVVDILDTFGCSKENLEKLIYKPKRETYSNMKNEIIETVEPTNKLNVSWVGLYELLYEATNKDLLQFSTGIREFNELDSHVELTVGDEKIETKYVIIADGSRSRHRNKLFSSDLKYTGFLNWRGLLHNPSNLEVDKKYPDYVDNVHIELGSDLHTGMQFLPEKILSWWMYLPVKEVDGNSLTTTPTKEQVEKFLKEVKPRVSEELYYVLSNADQYMTNVIADLDPLEQWLYGRQLLIGDSAHPITPNLGLGACGAVVDAYSLGNILEEHGIDEGLKFYQKTRLPIVSEIVRCSNKCGKERNSYGMDKDNYNYSYHKGHQLFISEKNIIHKKK